MYKLTFSLSQVMTSSSHAASGKHLWESESENSLVLLFESVIYRGIIVVLEKTLESPLQCKEIKPVNPKGNQPWIFIGRTEAEAPILWPPDEKNRLTGKDPEAGKDWRQEKGTTEDEMIGWRHRLNRHEFEQTPGDSEGQGSLVCCIQSWGLQRIGHNLATEEQKSLQCSPPFLVYSSLGFDK